MSVLTQKFRFSRRCSSLLKMTWLALWIAGSSIVLISPDQVCRAGNHLGSYETAAADVEQSRNSRDARFGSPYQLIGKAAPDFEANLLDGSRFKLSDHFGRNIIILEFWATWCKPCRMSLPALDKAAEKFKEEGVVFYAVNFKEKAERVRTFVQTEGYRFPVALDPTGETAKKYGVQRIPHTVIIGGDGKLAGVHIGVKADMEAYLAEEIRKLQGAGSEKEGENTVPKDQQGQPAPSG